METEAQQKDFEHLDYAYLGARYDGDYTVTLEQLNYWAEECQKLMKLTETICLNHIEKLKINFKLLLKDY